MHAIQQEVSMLRSSYFSVGFWTVLGSLLTGCSILQVDGGGAGAGSQGSGAGPSWTGDCPSLGDGGGDAPEMPEPTDETPWPAGISVATTDLVTTAGSVETLRLRFFDDAGEIVSVLTDEVSVTTSDAQVAEPL